MSLDTNLQNVGTRMATEAKALRTLINGNAVDLSALTTTAKSSLLAATNELHSLILSGGNSLPITGGTLTGRLGFQIPDFDVSLSSGDDGAIFTGPVGGQHLAIGDNEIQSKATGTTAGQLDLNPLGGLVLVGAGGLSVLGAVNFNLTLDVAGTAVFQDSVELYDTLQVDSIAVPALTTASGAVNIGNTAGTHLAFGGNDIQSKATGTTAATLDLNPLGGLVQVGAGGLTISGAGPFTVGTGLSTIGGKLRVSSTESPTLASGVGAVNIGSITGTHIAIGQINIQAKANATTATNLALNPLGGAVQIGTGGLSITGAGVFSGGTGPSSFGGKLLIGSTEVPALTSNTGALNIGAIAGVHVAIGGNDIQAKATATTSTTLDLNPLGGQVNLGTLMNVNGNTLSTTAAMVLAAGPGFGVAITGSMLTFNGSDVATDATVAAAISNLVDTAPTTLDTLNEIAAALGDDPNFATTMTTALGNRLRIDAAQGLNATQQNQGISNLGGTTVGRNILKVTNPSAAIRWLRVNADETVILRTAAETTADLDIGSTTTNYVTIFEAGLV